MPRTGEEAVEIVGRFSASARSVVLGLGLCFSPCAADGAASDTTKALVAHATPADLQAHPPLPHLLTRGDLLFLGGSIAGTALAVTNDRWLTGEAIEIAGDRGQRGLARTFQPLGNPAWTLAAALGFYGVARGTGHPQLACRAARCGLAVIVTDGLTLAIKEVLGRERPLESPERSNLFKPFSGHASFPSGHAATAFAAAVALDRETTSGWVPYVVYPAAALVSWSRVHDREHWTSDVVAGAALGGWTAWKTESLLAGGGLGVPSTGRQTGLILAPREGELQLAVVHRYE